MSVLFVRIEERLFLRRSFLSKMILDLCRNLFTHDLGKLVLSCEFDSLDGSERFQEFLGALFPNPLYQIQLCLEDALRPDLSVKRNCKAVRLIPDLLEQPQSGRGSGHLDRITLSGDKHFLESLRKADDRRIAHSEFLQYLDCA